jgi:hypothetical protein
VYSGEKVSRGLVVSGSDRPELLEPAEEVLDQMAGLVENLVVETRRDAIALWRDHGGLACRGERCKDALVGIERLVGDQDIGVDQRQEFVCPEQIMSLAGRQKEPGGIAEGIDGGVDLGA